MAEAKLTCRIYFADQFVCIFLFFQIASAALPFALVSGGLDLLYLSRFTASSRGLGPFPESAVLDQVPLGSLNKQRLVKRPSLAGPDGSLSSNRGFMSVRLASRGLRSVSDPAAHPAL